MSLVVAGKEMHKSPVTRQRHSRFLLQASTLGSLEALLSFLQDVERVWKGNTIAPQGN